MPQIIPIRDLKNTNEISQMCRAAKEPIFVTKNGYGDMVIMSMEVYEERMMMSDLCARLAQAEEDIEAGRVTEAKTSLSQLRGKYGLFGKC